MAYTASQLIMAWTAVHDGLAPTGNDLADLQNRAAQNAAGALTDAQVLGFVINSADKSTALAVLTYQFFTGKSPTAGGLDFLVNSQANANDLNDPYYAQFNLENRYINFAANLGVQGEGAAAFAAKYSAMSFPAYIAAIYETIVGATYAKAAGIDAAAAIAYLVASQDALLATARGSGMITPGMTQAQIDLALKAAAAGFLLAEAIKADIGLYAASANNFMLGLARGEAVYNTDITTTYAPTFGQGTGQPVTTAPSAETMPGYVAPPPPPPPPGPTVPQPLHFTLNANAETLTGAGLDDTFSGTHLTFNAGDVLDGRGGNDSLTITAAVSGGHVLAAASVTNIETATITQTGALEANTSGWTGLTALTATSRDVLTLTAAVTTDVTATNTNQGANAITLNGGHDVTLTTSNSNGVVQIGTTTAPTGAIVVDRALSGANPGYLQITGGASVDVTQTGGVSNISFFGSSLTASVKATGGDDVVVNDINRNSATFAGTITTAEFDGFTSLNFNGMALTTLTISHGSGVGIFNRGATGMVYNPTAATVLNVTVSDISSHLNIGEYQTLNLTRGVQASTFDLYLNTALTLAVDGDGDLTFSSVTADLVQTITVEGAGALDAGDLSGLATLATLDAGTATGAITATVKGGVTTVTTGSGDDQITMVAGAVSKALDLGDGDDTLILQAGAALPTVLLKGGAGTDTVVLDADDAVIRSANAAFAGQLDSFEVLGLSGVSNQSIDVGQLGYHSVSLADGNGVTLGGMSSGDTVILTGAGTDYTVTGAFGGADDDLNLRLVNRAGATFHLGELDADAEHLDITTLGDGAQGGAFAMLDLAYAGIKTIVVAGDGGVGLEIDSAALTSFDASGVTGGQGVGLGLSDAAAAVTVKGSATLVNQIDFSVATGSLVTYEGGAGIDIVLGGNGDAGNIIHLGEGVNYFLGHGATITAGDGDTYVEVLNGGATITVGDGDNVIIALDNAATTITTGSGDDQVFLGGGANLVDVGAGDDYVQIDSPTTASVFSTITGLGVGDILYLANQGTAAAATTIGAKLTGHSLVSDYVAAAVAGDGSATARLSWFQVGTDTYVVLDSSSSTTFDVTKDIVVKLTGQINVSAGTINALGEVTL